MSVLTLTSLATAICCGIWGYIAETFGFLTWAGFAGCTSYFANEESHIRGLFVALLTTLTGVAWATLAIYVSASFPSVPYISPIMTGVVTFGMCIQSKIKFLSFTPGAFMGAFSTFAGGGNWYLVGISIALGAVLGLICDLMGTVLLTLFGKEKKK